MICSCMKLNGVSHCDEFLLMLARDAKPARWTLSFCVVVFFFMMGIFELISGHQNQVSHSWALRRPSSPRVVYS